MVTCDHSKLCPILERSNAGLCGRSLWKFLFWKKWHFLNYPYFKGYFDNVSFFKYFIIIFLKKEYNFFLKKFHPQLVIFPFWDCCPLLNALIHSLGFFGLVLSLFWVVALVFYDIILLYVMLHTMLTCLCQDYEILLNKVCYSWKNRVMTCIIRICHDLCQVFFVAWGYTSWRLGQMIRIRTHFVVHACMQGSYVE